MFIATLFTSMKWREPLKTGDLKLFVGSATNIFAKAVETLSVDQTDRVSATMCLPNQLQVKGAGTGK